MYDECGAVLEFFKFLVAGMSAAVGLSLAAIVLMAARMIAYRDRLWKEVSELYKEGSK